MIKLDKGKYPFLNLQFHKNDIFSKRKICYPVETNAVNNFSRTGPNFFRRLFKNRGLCKNFFWY